MTSITTILGFHNASCAILSVSWLSSYLILTKARGIFIWVLPKKQQARYQVPAAGKKDKGKSWATNLGVPVSTVRVLNSSGPLPSLIVQYIVKFIH